MASSGQAHLELLLEVSRLLSSKLEIAELLESIVQLASRVVNAETGSLLLVDPKTNELYFDVALGLDPELTKVRLKMGQGIAGAVAMEGRTTTINDVKKDPRWSSTMDKWSGFVTRSILASPMKVKGKVIGVVEAINRIDGVFSEEDARIFEAFASQAAIAVENARLFSSLQEEKARLQTVFSEMTDGAILTDEDGRVILSNLAAHRILGMDSGFLVGIEEAFGGLVMTTPLADIMASKDDQVAFEGKRESPKLLILAGTASLAHFQSIGRQPATSGRLFVFRDVTAVRQEEALKRSFLSLISHKLKTPLASITGYSQLLLEDLPAANPPEFVMKAVKTISAQGNKLAEHVDKLLNFTTLEELKDAQIQRDSVPVGQVVTEALSHLKPWLEERQGSVEFKDPAALKFFGDPILLRDVMRNLVENGVKFAAENRKVLITAESRNADVLVKVQDHGPGIPPEEHEKVFDKFYQIEASFTGQVEGWGLGLPFVKKVVEQHGGKVWLDSRVGAGTTVSFTVPAPPAAP